MKLFYALIISLLLYTFDGSAKPFSPIVTNYSVSDYNSANQNWAVSQDRQGRLYFGNDSGLLEYDGANWQLYKLPTNGNIRSIYVDQKLDRIYVGSFEEFGFFCRDEFGLLHYTSLKDQTEDFEFRNDEIWNIIELDGDIIFQSFGSLFTYDGETVAGDRVNTLPLNLMLLNGVCYSQIMNKGLNIYSNNQFTEIISRSQLNNSEVVAILPHPKGMLLLTENSGGFIYDEHKIISPWNEECHEELTQYGINRAIVSPDSTYIVGTLSNGIYAYNSNGELLWSENTDNQLANNTILGLYCDADGNIWVALDNGISYINTKSPMYIFKPSSRSIGMIYDVDIDDEQIHIVSNQGVFNYSDDKLSALPNLEEQAWTLFRDGDQLLCGHNKGSIEISSNGSTKSISDIRGGLCFKRVELYDESILMQGTYTYLNIYRKNSDGKWQFSNSITSFSHMARNIEVDHRGNIWIEHMRKGIFKIRLDQKLEEVIEFKHYISLDDSDKTVSSKLFKINGRIVLTDGVKFYTYDDIEDSIIPYNDMNEQLSGMKPVYRVSQIDDHKYWFVSEQAIYLVNCDANTFTILDRIAYKTFGSFSTEKRAQVKHDKETNSSYLFLDNTIVKIPDARIVRASQATDKEMWISQFITFDKSSQQELHKVGDKIVLNANNNRVKIYISYPSHDNISYGVRYKLEGAVDSWSHDFSNMELEFTQLESGDYRLIVEAFNSSGVIASVEQRFTILRPWYASKIAILIFIALSLIVVSTFFYLINLRVIKARDAQMEQQRILHMVELARQEKKIEQLKSQQLESDLCVKSKEVSEFAMSNIVHQEFLNELRDEMISQRNKGQYTKNNLDKLLKMLNRNIITNEESWSVFQANFDRIHENFFRNLKEKYPDLTAGDLRLCALLRLNLPTKDIAKLMSISIRGVDAARYRLRKKLDISSEESLIDFMINFK